MSGGGGGGGSFRLIGFDSRNPLLSSRGMILSPPSLRKKIFFSLSMTSYFLLGLVFSFPGLTLRGVRDSEAGKFSNNTFCGFSASRCLFVANFPYGVEFPYEVE